MELSEDQIAYAVLRGDLDIKNKLNNIKAEKVLAEAKELEKKYVQNTVIPEEKSDKSNNILNHKHGKCKTYNS